MLENHNELSLITVKYLRATGPPGNEKCKLSYLLRGFEPFGEVRCPLQHALITGITGQDGSYLPILLNCFYQKAMKCTESFVAPAHSTPAA